MQDPNIYRKSLYIQAKSETGINEKYEELSPISNSSAPLGLYQRIEVTGIYDQTIMMDFGWGPEAYTFSHVYNTNFSGLEIEGDLKTNRIFQNNVNVGYNPDNYQGSNIGRYNKNYNSNIGDDITYNIGDYNQLRESESSFNLGSYNIVESGLKSFNIGKNNELLNLTKSNLIGNDNLASGSEGYLGQDVNVFGQSNYLINNGATTVIGDRNTLNSGYSNLIFGDDNAVEQIIYTTLVGESNILKDISTSDIYGDSNSLKSSVDFTLVGQNNILSGVRQGYIFGETNLLTQNGQGYIAGNSNSISNQINSFIFGEGNELQIGAENFTVGKTNRISGSARELILGKNNFNLKSTGNFIFGERNSIKNSNQNYNFGSNNIIENSSESLLLGKNNESIANYNNAIIGNSNSVSSTVNNIIIGRNNLVDSGNQNSILFGINSTLTGSTINSAINFSVWNSSLQINSSSIKLKSNLRPTINNSNIVISDDLGAYLNSSNGIGNSGSFDTLTIHDLSYDKISNQIELPSFSYTFTEPKYLCSFSGEVNGEKVYLNTFSPNTGNYFTKRSRNLYAGLHSLFADDFYESKDNQFELLFSKDLSSAGGWIISSKNKNNVLFYNTSTNSGIVPLTDWAVGTNGYDPAPLLEKVDQTEEGFQKQKLTLSYSHINPNFDFILPVYDSPDITVLYGRSAVENLQNSLNWLVTDKYSSGIYYVNTGVNENLTPQKNWENTGLFNSVVSTPSTFDSKISLGTRTGIISSYDPTYGKIYIPFFY